MIIVIDMKQGHDVIIKGATGGTHEPYVCRMSAGGGSSAGRAIYYTVPAMVSPEML